MSDKRDLITFQNICLLIEDIDQAKSLLAISVEIAD